MCAVIVGAEDVEPGLAMRLQKPLVGRNRRAPEAVAIDAYAVDQDRSVLVERIPAPGEPPRSVLHDQDLEISRGLRRMLRAMEEVDDDLRLELSLGQDVRATGAQLQEYDPGLDVIIIGLSQWANPAQTSKFLDSLTMARDAHVRNGALLVYFRISPLWSRDRKITHCGFDVSEQHPISLYSEADRLAALTRIILRIHRLLKTHKYEQNLLER